MGFGADIGRLIGLYVELRDRGILSVNGGLFRLVVVSLLLFLVSKIMFSAVPAAQILLLQVIQSVIAVFE